MNRIRASIGGVVAAAALVFAIGGECQTAPPATKPPATAKPSAGKKAGTAPLVLPAQMVLEPKAIAILKASSARLAAAKSMKFTAVVSYESPSRLGPPLIYSTRSDVVMQRPNKLRIVSPGDGPPSEFYYDGKVMMAFAPTENLVAVADAPPTIDAALQAAYDGAAIYFPFTDVLVADPYADIAAGLKTAFYIGQSIVVGDTTTDMVAYVTGDVFIQIWIGADDKLPRRIYAVYLNDKARLRHVLALSNWEIDGAIPADVFVSAKATAAPRMPFARPDTGPTEGMKPPPKPGAAKAPPAKSP